MITWLNLPAGTWSKRPDSGCSTTLETIPNNNNNNNAIGAIPTLDDTVSTLVENGLEIVRIKACRFATSLSRIHLEKLVISSKLKKFKGVSETHDLSAVFTGTLQWLLCRTGRSQSDASQVVTQLSDMHLIFSAHICLHLFPLQEVKDQFRELLKV